MAEREPAKKGAQKSAMSATPIDKGSKGFTAEERAAMRARARELKAEAREQEPERDVLAAIAEMQGPDRAMAKRLHAIVKARRARARAENLVDARLRQGRQGRLLLPPCGRSPS